MKGAFPIVTMALIGFVLLVISPVAASADDPFPNVTYSSGSFEDTFGMSFLDISEGKNWTPSSPLLFSSDSPIRLGTGDDWIPGTSLSFTGTSPIRLGTGDDWIPGTSMSFWDDSPRRLASGDDWIPGTSLSFTSTTPIRLGTGDDWIPGSPLSLPVHELELSDGTFWTHE